MIRRAGMLIVGLAMIVIPFVEMPERVEDITSTPPEMAEVIEYKSMETPEHDMSDTDLYWLARVMEAESGPSWEDWQIQLVGEVVLNRVAHDGFPDSIKEVVLQDGQYEPFFGDYVPTEPGERYLNIARGLMRGERLITDPDVIWQALFPQGDETYITIYDRDLGTTTYFCRSYADEEEG